MGDNNASGAYCITVNLTFTEIVFGKHFQGHLRAYARVCGALPRHRSPPPASTFSTFLGDRARDVCPIGQEARGRSHSLRLPSIVRERAFP